MRVLWLCLASTVVVAVPALLVLPPQPDEADEPAALRPSARAAAATRLGPQTRALPSAGTPSPGAACLALPEAASADDDALGSLRDELARVRGELGRAQSDLIVAQERIKELVLSQCVPRFRLELDEWLDGPLAGVCTVGDAAIREQLSQTLEAAAWLRKPKEWEPVAGRWIAGECPETVESLRLRYSAGVVAELANLFRAWRRDAIREPRLELVPGCSGPSAANVICNGQETRLPLDDPFVQSLLAEKRRFERHWQDQINSLLGVAIYEREWRDSAR